MKRKNLIYALTLLIACIFPHVSNGKGKGSPVPYLDTRLDRSGIVEGERLIYEVVLYIPDINLAGVECVRMPGLASVSYKRTASDTSFEKTEIGGHVYYTAVIDRYFVGFNESGKHSIQGGVYRVGVNRPVQVNDPFWGPSLQNRVEVVELVGPDVTVSVKPLPGGRPEAFSGAVGDFQVSASIPEGVVRAGEDACMIVSISGDGDLTNASLPEIRKMLPENLQFKSMTDRRSHYIRNGHLGSEIEIEVVFQPKSAGKSVVDGLSFVYYDSKRGGYGKAVAPPLQIEVADGIPSGRGPSVTYDI